MTVETPRRSKLRKAKENPSPCSPIPAALQPLTPRRSPRLVFSDVAPQRTPRKREPERDVSVLLETPRSGKKSRLSSTSVALDSLPKACKLSPASPDRIETRRGRRKSEPKQNAPRASKRKVFYRRVEYDGGEFEIGDDVYLKRREDAESDEEDPDVEDCRICFKAGRLIMLECDECLGGFHLKCLKPPLKEVPEGDWMCAFCEARKQGKIFQLPKPPEGKKIRRTFKEKLLAGDLWAARIESMWSDSQGNYWAKVRWYIIPEETAVGRQTHNLRRELYCTSETDTIEMESFLRHCYVMSPEDFSKAGNEGDDVFLCEYEYDVQQQSFKRLAEIERRDDNEDEPDEEWKFTSDNDDSSDDDSEYEKESVPVKSYKPTHKRPMAANSFKGRIFGLQKIGIKKIPEHVRSHKQTELEKAKNMLLLAALPKSLSCRSGEMEEITSFIKNAITENNCFGRCLYIHGVPGTGKTMTVHAAMRNLRSEVDAGTLAPYCLVEINGLKLSTPETIYRAIYEGLTGYRVGWKKALNLLNERFCEGKALGKEDKRPCILLIDELDLLVTKNQSVLYNILDWPTRPKSRLIVIGIANTMDLPEKLLPRISSRMGIQRLCFGPYNYQQLQEIISCRLKGIDVFEDQAVEFASRKVAAISGDARRALEICRRAAEVADYRQKQSLKTAVGRKGNPISASTLLATSPTSALFLDADKNHAKCHTVLASIVDNVVDNSTRQCGETGNFLVGISDVENAIQEMFQAPHIQVMKSCSRWSKILLVAMVHEVYRTGVCEITFEKLAAASSCLCASNGEEFPGWDILFKVGCKLVECRILLREDGGKHRLQKMQLNFPSDDVAFALKDCPEIPWLARYL